MTKVWAEKAERLLCGWCGRMFWDREAYRIHLVYGHESMVCPCGGKRYRKQTLEIAEKFDRAKGFTRRVAGGRYYGRTQTRFICLACGKSETSIEVSARVSAGPACPES